jgi:GTPase SAR1 family protein
VDTPGQIEIFTWSASGAIITEAFASTFPTVVAYVVDTPRSTNPVTFMSNMLYACSILYKTRLPLVLTFNKVDVAKHEFAIEVCIPFMTVLFSLLLVTWFYHIFICHTFTCYRSYNLHVMQNFLTVKYVLPPVSFRSRCGQHFTYQGRD